jgi:muconate cycloisomerase
MSETERVLTGVRHGRTECRLVEPYVLSFATITAISSLWAVVEDDRGRKGVGEAVPLPGYADEEAEGIVRDFDLLCPLLEGKTVTAARTLLASKAARRTFAVSALMSAIDLLAWPTPSSNASIPIVFPLAAGGSPDNIVERIEAGFKRGYRHFKLKTGRNVEDDVACALAAGAALSRLGATLRCDANQGYSFEAARRFCEELGGACSEEFLWLEQPLAKDDWRGMERLCEETALPLILDEPIYAAGDIDRAASIGCAGVKLKLVKHHGMYAVLDLARRANGLGLEVVMGNGVSSDIGNYCEALVVASEPALFAPGAECNGFVKIAKPLCHQGLAETGGSVVIKAAV